jgi:hypothetical protein
LVEDGFHILGESGIGRRRVGQQAQCLSQRPSAAGRARVHSTVVWVDDDIGRPLTVDYNYLLMTGDGFPSAAGDADFLCPDRGHDLRLPCSRTESFGTVRDLAITDGPELTVGTVGIPLGACGPGMAVARARPR